MKTGFLLLALLLISAQAQSSGYNFRIGDNLNLPTSLPFGSSSSSSFSSSSSSSSFSSGQGSGSSQDFNSISYPKADLLKLSDASGVSIDQRITMAINAAKTELSTPVRSIPSLFTRFPSSNQVVKMAGDGDIGGLTKLLSIVASDDSVPCGTKISYLLDLQGAVKDAIRRKSLVADLLLPVIQGAKAQIQRLQNQIIKAQSDRVQLGIPNLQSRITDLSGRLSQFYGQISAIRTQISPQEARILGFQKQLNIILRQNDNERSKITNNKVQLAQTDNSIRDLQNKLQQLRDKRNSLLSAITQSQNIIRENQRKVDNIKSTIIDITMKIKSLKDTIDTLKRQSNIIEVDLERVRTDLSVAKAKDNKIVNDINDLKNRIKIQEDKIVDDVLGSLQTIIANLNRFLPNINNDINRQYYYCYGAGRVETVTAGSTIVYVVRGDAFINYIQNAYGNSVAAPRVLPNNDYRLQVVDPYSQIWTSKFGLPFSSKGTIQDALNYGSNFSCVDMGSSAQSGSGRITGISGDSMSISGNDGRALKFSIGGCSRIQSTTSLPQVGQNVYWRGAPAAGGYNLHAATCW